MATRYNYTGGIVTNGLVLNLDAAKTDSYPGTGTTWRDLSGNSNNGTLTNGPTFSGIGKQASIVFDGSDDYVELLPSYNTITTSGTVEIAIKFNGTNVYKHIWVFDKTDAPEVRLSTDQGTGNFGFQVYDNGSYRFIQYPITPIMYNNTWIYVQAVWGNNDYRIYLNGSLVSNQTSGGIITNTGPATTSRLGNYPRAGGSQFNGSIGTFRIYNRALTAQEITQNFNALRGRYGI
jgi:hypothetical protein